MKKIGIIGVGAIAQTYIDVLRERDFACVGAVTDPRVEAAKAAAEASGCKTFDSFDSLAHASAVDAVIICTPPATHPEIATRFLAAGTPVLCEKPLSIDEAGARSILDAGQSSGTLVTMASKFRYMDDIINAKMILASGLLGEIQLIENAFASPVDMSKRWNSQPAISGGGVWIDNGTHSVDVIRFLTGPITDILMVCDSFDPKLSVEDNAFALAKTQSGAKARIDLSWTFNKQLDNFIRIYGTHGTLHIGWRGSKYKQHSSTDWVAFGTGYDKKAAFRNKLRNFCDAIDGRETPLITAEDAMASVQVIRAGYESAACNGWMRVGEGSDAPRVPRRAGEHLSVVTRE